LLDDSPMPYLLAYAMPITCLLGFYLSLPLPIILTFILTPIGDLIIGKDDHNPSPQISKELDKRISFRLVTWLWGPVQCGILIWGLGAQEGIGWSNWINLVIGVGIVGGMGISCAHELIHRTNEFEVGLGKAILITVCYGHFYIEHIWGHHKRVSTNEDPGSARYGESYYSFWVRTVSGSFMSAWNIEKQRLKKINTNVLSPQNQVIQFVVLSMTIASLITSKYGFCGLLFFIIQSIVAFSLLELINYIEHYGLERKKNETNEYERVTPAHSWNSRHRITNYFLFKLQRHSDHHANSSRRYQTLRSWKSSPQLPTGYGGMFVLSLIPPLFFKVMNPRVKEVKRKEIEIEKMGINPFIDPSFEYSLPSNSNT